MNKKKLELFERLLSSISTDFDCRVLDDPEFASDIPRGSYVLFQVKYAGLRGPAAKEIRAFFEEFNAWVKELANCQPDHKQPIYRAILTVQYGPSSPPKAWRSPEHFPRDFHVAAPGAR